MKKLAMLAVAVALVAFAPRDAAAQGSQSTSIGAVFPTLLGACTGGAIGYYFVTGPLATFIGPPTSTTACSATRTAASSSVWPAH